MEAHTKFDAAIGRAPLSDRLPPHSIEGEQGVLGCILLDAKSVMPICIEKLRSGGEEFYDLRHKVIYGACLKAYDEQKPGDVIAIMQELKDANQLELVGGLAYLSVLPDAVPSALNIEYFLEIVLDKFSLRRIIQACTDAVAKAYENTKPKELVEEHEKHVLEIITQRPTGQVPIKASVLHALQSIEAMHGRSGLTGIATGFIDLDKLTCGLRGSDLIVIAGRPSCGKTALAMNIAERVAVDDKLPVGVFSMEMSSDALVLRLLCTRARVDSKAIREGIVTEGDFPKLSNAAGAVSAAPLYIDDSSGLSVIELRSKARRMHQLYDIKLLIVDYLQLMNAGGEKQMSREREVAAISGGLKGIAKELKIPVIALSQLNREIESKSSKVRKPRLSDLRESGSIEQDADVVGMLYRPDEGEESNAVNLLIAKQRNGPTGDVRLEFIKNQTRFVSAARITQEDVP